MQIKNVENGDFKSLILKQKIVEIYGFRCLAIGYFRKGLIWGISEHLYTPQYILGKEYKNYTLKSQISPNFWYDFYTKAAKKGCKMCDIFLVLDTPCGIWEKMKGQLIVLSTDNFFIFNMDDISFDPYEINEKHIFYSHLNSIEK